MPEIIDMAEYARRLTPLLHSIEREISERTLALVLLESRRGDASQQAPRATATIAWEEEREAHRRAIVASCGELAQLGCTVVTTEPLVLIVPASGTRGAVLWQHG